jgi:hypothetical protein
MIPRYDPANGPAIHDPSFADAFDLLDSTIGPDAAWNRDNITAGLQRMAAATKRSSAQRAVTVLEKFFKRERDPIGALESMGRPSHDGELLGIVNVR